MARLKIFRHRKAPFLLKSVSKDPFLSQPLYPRNPQPLSKTAAIGFLESGIPYRAMIDQSVVGVCMFDRTRLVFANRKTAEILGYESAQELIGRNAREFLTPESYRLARKRVIARLAGLPLPGPDDYDFLKKNGEKAHVQIHFKEIFIAGKSYVHLLVIDRTEKERAERNLKERMDELQMLYRVHAHTIMAHPLEQVLREIVQDLVLTCRIQKAIHARIMFDGCLYYSSRSRNWFKSLIREPITIRGSRRGWIELGYIESVPKKSAESLLFLSQQRQMVKDVARTLERHIASREIFERYGKLVRKLNTGVFILEKGIFRYVNPKICKIFRTKEEEILGRPFSHFILESPLRSPGKSVIRSEVKARRKNGQILFAELMLQTIDYHGKEGLLGTLQDITRLKRAEERMKHFNQELQHKIAEKTRHLRLANERLRSLNELKDEFIAVTSHELRSPLTAVRGYLSFLTAPDLLNRLSGPARDYLTRAYNNVELLNNLVNNILDVSRLESGQFELRKTMTDLISLVKRVVDNLAIHLSEKKISIHFNNNLRQTRCMVQLDSIRIQQVLLNLLDNAIKYSKPRKMITVTLRCANSKILPSPLPEEESSSIPQGWVEIEIKDQGIGIPSLELSAIFEKFVQAKNAAWQYQGGVGLGLFITKKIVELHGGTITVKSQLLKGTTFVIRLPIT